MTRVFLPVFSLCICMLSCMRERSSALTSNRPAIHWSNKVNHIERPVADSTKHTLTRKYVSPFTRGCLSHRWLPWSSTIIRFLHFGGIHWRRIRQMAPLVRWPWALTARGRYMTSIPFNLIKTIFNNIYKKRQVFVRLHRLFVDLVWGSPRIRQGRYMTPYTFDLIPKIRRTNLDSISSWPVR